MSSRQTPRGPALKIDIPASSNSHQGASTQPLNSLDLPAAPQELQEGRHSSEDIQKRQILRREYVELMEQLDRKGEGKAKYTDEEGWRIVKES